MNGKMSKKGTITSRTLEKLGWLRFRSHSQSDVENKSQNQNATVAHTTSVNTITAGELDISTDLLDRFSVESLSTFTDKKPLKKTFKDRFTNHKQEEKQPTAKFYLDDTSPTMVTTATGDDAMTTSGEQSPKHEKKKVKTPPDGTHEYIVKESDTLQKIAAHFDTTPSELKKLNKLMTTSMIFAGQVLFVPDKDYEKSRTPSVSNSDEGNSQSSSVSGNMPDRPTMDLPLIKAVNSSPTKVPGHVERQPATSAKDLLEYEIMIPHKLTEDEAEQLDKDCLERFIKLNVKHITDGQRHFEDKSKGVVKGVLLVTPNAVMFDPDVSDPLVLERGHERYGLIAPMDLIISAAMYHDISAMKHKGMKREDGSPYPRPEVYHDKNCPMARQKLEESQSQSKGLNIIPERIQNILRNPLNKSDSVCSCGHGSMEVDFGDSFDVLESVEKQVDDAADEQNGANDTKQKGIDGHKNILANENDKAHGNEKDKAGCNEKEKAGEKDKGVNGNVNDVDTDQIHGKERIQEESKDAKVGSDKSKERGNTLGGASESVEIKKSPDSKQSSKKLVSFSLDSPIDMNSKTKEDLSKDAASKVNDKLHGDKADTNKGAQHSQVTDKKAEKESKAADKDIENNSDSAETEQDKGQNETRIGNIVYMPIETDVNGEFTAKSLEVTKTTLSKLSSEKFENQSKSDTDLNDDALKQQPETVSGRIRTSSSSSLGPFSPTPHISAFVNYATGFFQKTLSDNNIKDITEANLDPLPPSAQSTPKRDVPVVASAPLPGKRKGKMSRHAKWADVEVESAVSLEEKGDLLTMDYDKFAPRKSTAYPDPPLYLCLRLGTPQNKSLQHNYTIESYGKRRKKSEYWFSIPREKVDHLYAFFVQWSPELYGDEEDLTAEKRGFVVIDEEDDDEDMDMLDEHFGPNSSFQKDWEIISASEASKRRSIVFDEPLPPPDLIGDSAILTDDIIECLVPEMPGRTIGYPWHLVYSTYKHGFSLKTLYRVMHGLESPILIVVKDTNDKVFGALTSEELKISDHFYGTGETFLFTFHPEFTVFHWSGENSFFLKGNQESLSIGAGQGVYGLWFDEDIYHGRTNKCETFANDVLTVSEDFVVKGFEAWAFV